jgi:hypothetical protein
MLRAYMDLALSMYYAIDYNTQNDEGNLARAVVCPKGHSSNNCDWKNIIEHWRFNVFGMAIKGGMGI